MDEEMNFQSQLEDAIRRRILEEIAGQKQAQVINNLYGGGGSTSPTEGSSIRESMGTFNPRDYEYFVEIDKTPRRGPEGEDLGWEKMVRRYAQRVGE